MKSLRFIFTLLFFTLFVFSCEEEEATLSTPVIHQADLKADFFRYDFLSSSNPNVLPRPASRRNELPHFEDFLLEFKTTVDQQVIPNEKLAEIVEKLGYPAWDRAFAYKENAQGLVAVPFAKKNGKGVKGHLLGFYTGNKWNYTLEDHVVDHKTSENISNRKTAWNQYFDAKMFGLNKIASTEITFITKRSTELRCYTYSMCIEYPDYARHLRRLICTKYISCEWVGGGTTNCRDCGGDGGWWSGSGGDGSNPDGGGTFPEPDPTPIQYFIPELGQYNALFSNLQREWLSQTGNTAYKNSIVSFLTSKNYSSRAVTTVLYIIDSILLGANAQELMDFYFAQGHVNDWIFPAGSFAANPRTMSIYKKLMSDNYTRRIAAEVFGLKDVLTFDMRYMPEFEPDPNNPGYIVWAVTKKLDPNDMQDYNYQVIMNPAILEHSDFFIAQTIIHEMVHTRMFYMLQKAGLAGCEPNGNITIVTSTGNINMNFLTEASRLAHLAAYYNSLPESQTKGETSHSLFNSAIYNTQSFRETIRDCMKRLFPLTNEPLTVKNMIRSLYNNNSNWINLFYEDVSWIGLSSSHEYLIKTLDEKTRIQNAINICANNLSSSN